MRIWLLRSRDTCLVEAPRDSQRVAMVAAMLLLRVLRMDYYTLVDVNDLAKRRHGEGFAAWKASEVGDVKFLEDLAVREGVVLMNGPGFDAPAGCVRVSLANLNKDEYVEIARRVNELLDGYYAEYEKAAQPANAA